MGEHRPGLPQCCAAMGRHSGIDTLAPPHYTRVHPGIPYGTSPAPLTAVAKGLRPMVACTRCLPRLSVRRSLGACPRVLVWACRLTHRPPWKGRRISAAPGGPSTPSLHAKGDAPTLTKTWSHTWLVTLFVVVLWTLSIVVLPLCQAAANGVLWLM
jgi:hypothetical protein